MHNELTIKYLKLIGLTTSEAQVVELILRKGKPLSQSEIVLETQLSTGAVSSSLKKALKEEIIKTHFLPKETKTHYLLSKSSSDTLTQLYLNKMMRDQQELLKSSKRDENLTSNNTDKNTALLIHSIEKNLEYTKRIKSLLELEK